MYYLKTNKICEADKTDEANTLKKTTYLECFE